MAIEKAQSAVDLAEDDPLVLTVLGAALTITKQHQAGLLMIEKALALDPNSAWAWNRSGWLRVFLDDPETGIGHSRRPFASAHSIPWSFNAYVGIAARPLRRRATTRPLSDWCEKACLTKSRKAVLRSTGSSRRLCVRGTPERG